ncbi:MAG TPA: hypothetical protein DEB40_01380 [Elusimicrobia bacterium]|nr:hypothetical protein [Elusimicrobiota bacterium]HBT60382.1 hypothetical protein [Elusimicrobiota bacterium]
MESSELRQKLIAACSSPEFVLPPGEVVIQEPYIPHLPKVWKNGTLVLAESQNLGVGNEDYVQELRAMTPVQRFLRLQDAHRVRVQPWDDGTLKLAVAAVWGSPEVDRVAVSNAVPWSQRGPDGSLKSPSWRLQEKARGFWRGLLDILRPARIVTTGAISYGVMSGFNEFDVLRWPSASSRALAPLAGAYDEGKLLSRFPEVAEAIGRHPEWVSKSRKHKVLFCSLAMTQVGRSLDVHRT